LRSTNLDESLEIAAAHVPFETTDELAEKTLALWILLLGEEVVHPAAIAA
jgi:hypothetical protein